MTVRQTSQLHSHVVILLSVFQAGILIALLKQKFNTNVFLFVVSREFLWMKNVLHGDINIVHTSLKSYFIKMISCKNQMQDNKFTCDWKHQRQFYKGEYFKHIHTFFFVHVVVCRNKYDLVFLHYFHSHSG